MKNLRVALELTNHCNFRCTYCPHSVYQQETGRNVYDRPEGFMPREMLDTIIPNARKYARSVSIGFFGEPLLHPQFEEFTAALHANRNYTLVLNTNGSLITEKMMDAMRMYDYILISLDGASKSVWESVCPSGKVKCFDGSWGHDRWDTLNEKIRQMMAIKDRPSMQLVFVVTDALKDTIDSFMDRWKPHLRRNTSDCLMAKTILSYGGVMQDTIMQARCCTVARDRRMVISWQGECSPCNLDVNMGMSVGNLNQTPDFKAILEGPRYAQMIQNIRRKQGVCHHCTDGNNLAFRQILKTTRGFSDQDRRKEKGIQ